VVDKPASWEGLRGIANHPVVRGVRGSIWALADQALISAANFVLMVLLARELGPQAFGGFVLAQAVLMFTNNVQLALFAQPHNVLGAPKHGDEYARYTRSVLAAQIAFAFAASLVVFCVGVFFLHSSMSFGPLLLVLAFTLLSWQLQDFLRRVFYTHGDFTCAFQNNLLAYGVQLTGVLMLWHAEQLTASLAMAAIGVGAFCGLVLAVWQLRTVLIGPLRWTNVRMDVSANWRFGQWLLGSVIAGWLSAQLYYILTAVFVGTAATGGMRATQNVVAPTHVLLKSMEAMVPARSARILADEGVPGLRRFSLKIGSAMGGAMLAYCALAFVAAEPIIRFLVGDQYVAYAWVARVFAISYMLTFLATVSSTVLTGMGNSKSVFRATIASAFVVLTFGIWAVASFGLPGAMLGIIVHGLIVNGILWNFLRLALKQ
jgi:O-antigen/teichoic acid export membrane protein